MSLGVELELVSPGFYLYLVKQIAIAKKLLSCPHVVLVVVEFNKNTLDFISIPNQNY